MHQSTHTYFHGEQKLEGYLAYSDNGLEQRPAVLVVHDWSGRNAFACDKAKMLAELGYVGFAVDMYGDARVGESIEEKTALMQEVVQDRRLLRARILAAFEAVKSLKQVDPHRIAVIGFCFGGLCALDLARSGAAILGTVSFHGLLNKPADLDNRPIRSKILVLHGYNDPMVTPEQVNAFCREMTDAAVDWQVHMYGNTQHAFTNPAAHDEARGLIYNVEAERRAFQAMTQFLSEIFLG